MSSARAAVLGIGRSFVESIGPPDDVFEREADRVADAVIRGELLAGGIGWAAASGADDTVRRKCECEQEEDEQIRRAPKDATAIDDSAADTLPIEPMRTSEPAADVLPEAAKAPEADEERQPDPAAADARPVLLVDDEGDASHEQMGKSDFLRELRVSLCAAVDEGLSGTGRTSKDCPWIDHWLGYYEGRSASKIETSLHRFAPESRGVSAAGDYIPIVAARVRRSAETYATTGEITGVPEEMSASVIPRGGVLAAFGGMFFKARSGGARAGDPVSVRAQLGAGQPLPSAVRTRMESAFGASFSDVQLHTDPTAARLSDRLNAHAFTIGRHVAFGSGEFRPGTVVGDALIAHELAHVVQQGRSGPSLHQSSNTGLERDADTAAAAALWRGIRGRGAYAAPRLRSGLSLARCSKTPAIDLKALTPKERASFIDSHFEKNERTEAKAILDDIIDSQDDLRFADLEELSREIHKRIETTRLMKKTQDLFGVAFEYPNKPSAKQCVGGRKNPRVNKAAEKYWGPVQQPEGTYYFDLSDEGKKDPYQALVTLFTPQKSICDMTLIHCDYLASVVHFRAFAERIGAQEFNRRVIAGDIKMQLRYDGFVALKEGGAPSDKGISLRQVIPASERDLVIGDHVIFWNHRAYDAINLKVKNAWRLENAILIEKKRNADIFLGHGSGRKTNSEMRDKLAHEYNTVVKMAKKLIKAITKGDSKSAAARSDMATTFPNVHETGGKWIIETTHKKNFEVEEVKGSDPDLAGLRDPDDPSKMNPVKRPVESE